MMGEIFSVEFTEMEEIESRLEIIRLAVDLGDQAAVSHQVTHMRNLTTDPRLHAILDDLERHNFHQALFAIREYQEHRRRGDDFFAPESSRSEADTQDAAPTLSRPQEQELFGLEEPKPNSQTREHILSVDEMLAMTRQSATTARPYEPPPSGPEPIGIAPGGEADSGSSKEAVDEMALFDLGTEEETPLADKTVPQPKVETPVSDEAGATEPFETASLSPEAEASASKSGLFDLDDRIRAAETSSSDSTGELFDVSAESFEVSSELFGSGVDTRRPSEPTHQPAVSPEEESVHEYENTARESHDGEDFISEESPVAEEETMTATVSSVPAPPEAYELTPDEPRYEAFAYMGQKFRNMLHQFPQKVPYEDGVYIEAQRFIDRVSSEDYTESQVEAMIARYQELKAEGYLAEAAQVLIAAATTESRFAQFMLARELFKGDVLVPDHAEAFTQINRMAEEDYPEAICDLGQLYEHGIGIDKNKRHALLLYEEAAALGIERARHHYERLRRSNPLRTLASLFSRS